MKFTKLISGQSLDLRKIPTYFFKGNDKKFNENVYFIAGIHGDEPEGVYVLKRLFEWMEYTFEEDIYSNFVFVPVVNPDGLAKKIRNNENMVDLNRNFPSSNWKENGKGRYYSGPMPFSEPESRYLGELFSNYPPSLTFSFHSWNKSPAINFDSIGKQKSMTREISEFFSRFNNYEILDSIGYPTPGSLGSYVSEKYNSPVITFEFPSLDKHKTTFEEIWKNNERGLKEFIFTLSS